MPPAADAGAIGGKGVTGTVGGVAVFVGSPSAAAERVSISTKILNRISALNEDGKTVSVLLAGDEVAGLIAMRDEPRADARCMVPVCDVTDRV